MKKLWLLLLAPALMCGAIEWDAYELAQLKGLRILDIVVDHLPDAITVQRGDAECLSDEQMTRLVSDKLTQVGLHVTDSAGAFLSVSVTAVSSGGWVAYDAQLELEQPAYLARNSAKAFAVVCMGNLVGLCPENRIVSTVREDVDGLVNDFVIGWLLANKKK